MKYLTKFNLGIAAIVLLLVLYLFGSCGKTDYQKQMNEWKHRAAVAVAVSDSVKAENDRLTTLNIKRDSITTAQGKEIERLRSTQSVMRKKNDAKLSQLEKTLPDTCKAALDLAKDYRKEADTLLVALDTAHARDSVKTVQIRDLTRINEKFRVSNDSLKKLVITVPVYKEAKVFGFIPMPSRKVSFIAGAILAVVVKSEIARH